MTEYWNSKEEALVLYFASIGVYHHAISDILIQRHFTYRSPKSISRKLERLIHDHGLQDNRTWIQSELDMVLDSLQDYPNLLELLRPRVADQVIINRQLIREIPEPSSAFPQLVFLMGRGLKDQALRQLCASSYRKKQRGINLCSDTNTLNSLRPRFFADCNPLSHELSQASDLVVNCHAERDFEIEPNLDQYPCQDLILARLLFLFTDVICIFADDVGGLDGVRQLLQTWTKIGSASSLPAATRPRVIIVESQSQSATDSVLDEEDLLSELSGPGSAFFQVFGDLEVFYLPQGSLSPQALFLGLRREISQQLQRARAARDRHNAIFSANHFNRFFDLALSHTSHLSRPFNFIRSARESRPLDDAFASHLTRFISAANKTRLPYDSVASYIASAILMDAYPQGMHKFNPSSLFLTIYRRLCQTGMRNCYSTDDFTVFMCRRIEGFLVELFEKMETSGVPSYQLHSESIKAYQAYWNIIRSTKTCFWCIQRDPEHSLGCGHMICDACVETFGKQSPQYAHEYKINYCILCGKSSSLLIRLKPPTAAPRILSIDGGGPRGIIPLENLEILQELIGPDIDLPDLIDLQMGTSSGGIIALTLTMLRMTITESKTVFETLAKKVFSQKHRRHFLKAWVSDEIYDSGVFDEALKSHFGDIRLLDAPTSHVSSRKVSVTVSQIKGGDPCIFANYGGGVPHSKGRVLELCYLGSALTCLVYERLDPTDDPLVWQVYFSTETFFGLGTFQDGGMSGHNCPIELAMLETRRIWRTIAEPDVVISLGTGYQESKRDSNMTRFRNFLVDGFGPRSFRSGMESAVGKKESRRRYFRFDPSFPTALPPMGDTDCMDSLSSWVRNHSENWESHRLAARALLTSCFYFQLDREPEYQVGKYFCTGTIQTRMPARPLIRQLKLMGCGDPSFYHDRMNLGLSLLFDDICEICDQYFLPVRFYIRDLEDKVTLCLRTGRDSSPLSNFPNKMIWFVEEQRLNCPFGPQIIPARCACKDRRRKRGVKRKFMEI
ncbi:FabD/lysophospholipase-like protein [Aspergillus californicus]